MKALLAHEGIDVNSQDGNGLMALHRAVLERFGVGVKALLAHKDIDVEVKDKNGVTPLQLATELELQGNSESDFTAAACQRGGADVGASDKQVSNGMGRP